MLRQDDDEDDEKRNAGDVHGCLPLTLVAGISILCSDYQASCVNHGHILSHEKVWFACNLFDEIVILGLSTHKIVASP